MSELKEIYQLPVGFKSAAVHAGIKADASREDMTLVVSEVDAVVAGVFTKNKVKAAPVKLGIQQIAHGRGRAIVANSGNANACTGEVGDRDAQYMADYTAEQLGVPADEVCVCSTGCIGNPLPMDRITAGIAALVPLLSSEDQNAPQGILTSDTGQKVITVELNVDGKPVRITAMAKGAGMIEPNMATMLCFILTDADVEQKALQEALSSATQLSFNRISVDGDMSTNDTVLVLANGRSGNTPLNAAHPDWNAFSDALDQITLDLALKIVDDGEGTTKIVTLQVSGAATDEDADTAARAIANSLLVKTAWAGDYPVWGRIMDVLGYADIALEENRIGIAIGPLSVTEHGLATATSQAEVLEITDQKAYTIGIELGLGSGKAVLYTTDCTEEYVRLNMV